MQFDEYASFLDLDIGKVETVSKESPPKTRIWIFPTTKNRRLQDASFPQTAFSGFPPSLTLTNGPSWRISPAACSPIESAKIFPIHGAGAFRNFKYIVRRDGIEQAWFAFRTDALMQISIDWCEENQITRV
ncbi:MAG: hypothetical protein ABSE86_15720 [Bryobacteraceae bacterium]